MNREHVKRIALKMVQDIGLINLSRKSLCESAGIADGSFPHVMGCNFTEFIEEIKPEAENVLIYQVGKTRTAPGLRKEQILNVAIDLARNDGYHNLTRDGIAEQAGVSMGLVTRYFETMAQLKRAVMQAAIHREIPEIIAQGLVIGDKQARKAPEKLKAAAADILMK
jgi:hypothetical protein